jgi:hypothetical protein
MTLNIIAKPRSLWNAYRIPRGISTIAMNGGMVRRGRAFDFLTIDGVCAVSELVRRELEACGISSDTELVGIFCKALQVWA